jgi:ferritin-like metal-binding protein YciE
MKSLKELYVKELEDLYSAEHMILKALPKLAKAASSSELQQAFDEHRIQTQSHVERLDDVFGRLGEKPKAKKCRGMEGLLEEGKEILEEKNGDASVKDAALIASAQRVEHYEMAGYGCVRTFAHLLGDHEAAGFFQKTLEEEKKADLKLTEIAENLVNPNAAEAPEEIQRKSSKAHRRMAA